MRDLNVAIIQENLAWLDPPANRSCLETRVRQLDQPADLVILPEMFTTGFTMDTTAHAETMHGETRRWMSGLAAECNVVLCGSLIIKDGGRYYNRLLWMTPTGEHGFYDKRHLFRMAGEHRHFAPGAERRLFDLGGWRILPLVCYDLRFPVWSRGAGDLDLLVYVANWPAARRSAWQALLPARAIENQCYVAGVNRVGVDGNELPYAGDSGVYDYLGRTLEHCGDEPATGIVRLDRAALDRYRDKFPAFLDADRFEILPGPAEP